MDHMLDTLRQVWYNILMKTEAEYNMEQCSQEIATILEIDNPHLFGMGLSGFEIYELMADGEIG